MGCFSSKESKNEKKLLKDCVKGDYAIFNLYNYKTTAKIVDVYDGDSIQVIFDYIDGQRIEVKVRMYGYDAMNIRRPKKEENREENKKKAEEIRDDLANMIADEVVNIQFKAWDKYGRIKAIITHNDLNINKWMIDTGKADIIEGEILE